MLIAQYRGISTVSWVIRGQTRSLWSHTAPILPDFSVVEAWHKVGVDHVDEGDLIINLSKNHKPGTIVDLFKIEATATQNDDFAAFLLDQVGMPYDFSSVFRFVIHKPASENGKWFCSEVSSFGLNEVKIEIQCRICPSHISPQLHGISPLMIPFKSIITGTESIHESSKLLCHQS